VRPITANPNLSPKAYSGGLNLTIMSPMFTKLVPIEMISAEDVDYQDVKQKSKNLAVFNFTKPMSAKHSQEMRMN